MTSLNHNRHDDIKLVADILNNGEYDYNQSKHLIARARKQAGLTPTRRRKGSVERLTDSEVEGLLEAAGAMSKHHGLMIRTLFETGSRVSAFCRMRVEDIDFDGQHIRVIDKGNRARDIPIRKSLADELRIYVGERKDGYVFLSRRGDSYSSRRIQQLVKAFATDAGINKRVYPHLLRHTIAQRLADRGMPENLLQRFLGHSNPMTTQIYYEPRRTHVQQAFFNAMAFDSHQQPVRH